jgi:hypothetical protein
MKLQHLKMGHSRDIYEIAAETSLPYSGTQLLEHLKKPQISKFSLPE